MPMVNGRRGLPAQPARVLRAGAASILCIALIVGATLRAAARVDDPVRVEIADVAMGATFAVVLYGHDRAALEAAADRALDEAHRLDALLSNFRPASEWSAVNREAGEHPVPVSAELFDLLAACLEYSRLTEGAFDITVGPLVRAWGFHGDDGALPPPEAIASARARVGYGHVQLDRDRRTVRFLRDGVELDPGGIGKGYAVDRMVDVLEREGVRAALVSAGNSSIYGLGAPPDSPDGWPIEVSDPYGGERPVATVHLKDLALSTSGAATKSFTAGGRRYSHIIDPRSGYPARGAASVSVIAPTAIETEAWSKPYFINGRAWTKANRRPGHRVLFCGEEPEASCSWIP